MINLKKQILQLEQFIKDIIETKDFSKRIDISGGDAINKLTIALNSLLSGIENDYNKIKEYAFKAVLAQKKETKIRKLFQKYVPYEVINNLFSKPITQLVGENKILSVLFSGSESFTSILESIAPAQLTNFIN